MQLTQVTCVFTLSCMCAAVLSAERQYKSPEEYEMYTAVTKAFAANDTTKALAELDAWKLKFPESDYAANRQQLYVQAYARSNQPMRALEAAKTVAAGPFDSPDDELRLLFAVVTMVQQISEPPADVRPLVADAARRLMSFDKMPAGTKAEDWAKARESLGAAARVALLHVGLTPVREALKSGDCPTAESEGIRIVKEHPESVQAAWVLGSAQLCLARRMPEKFAPALYSLARAAALDPVKGLVDPAWQKNSAAPYLEKAYAQYHGVDPEGLRELKETALRSTIPPEGFTILSSVQVEQRKQAELESKNPELALWLRIREALAAANGESYFASELKDSAVPPLSGMLMSSKPACRPTQLSVIMAGTTAELLIKFSKPLGGRPELNSVIRFEAVPTAFTREPFLLTVESDPTRVTGLKLAPCSARGR